MSDKDDIKRLISAHKRRLQVLKEQQALQGAFADPRIILEIEDIEAKTQALQMELRKLEDINNLYNTFATQEALIEPI